MNPYDPSPNVQRKEGVSSLDVIKTSPIEVAKFIRNIKKSQFSQCGIPGKFNHLVATPITCQSCLTIYLKLASFQTITCNSCLQKILAQNIKI